MALVDTTWYLNFGNGSSTGYYAVAQRAPSTAVAAGAIRRQFTTPAVGSERCFICTVAGTTSASADATWTLTRGAKSALDGTVQWQEVTGQAALNGDLTNTATWAQVKAATPAVLGQVIKRSNNASYQICTTAGAMSASEPAFSDTAGVTTTDTTAVWTSLGAVSNFTGGQAPHARFNNVFGTSWFASGNTVYVGDNHAEAHPSGNLISGPVSALLAKILCHNHSGSYPPASGDLTTGATIGNVNGTVNFTGSGSFYFYGITFSAFGLGVILGATAATNQNWYYFDNCSMRSTSTASSSVTGIYFGDSASTTWNNITLNNTTVSFGHTTNSVMPRNTHFYWRNTGPVLVSGSSVPSALISQASSLNGPIFSTMLEGLDLSQMTGSIFASAFPVMGNVLVKDCKLNATTSITTPTNTGMTVQLAASDSGATSYKSSRYTYEAVETTETSIVRTGGYQDPQGQAQSRKIVTTATIQWLRPYAAQPLAVWNADVGSPKTVTVYGTVNSASLPNNDDIWLEVSGLTNASFPVGSTVTSGKANVWSANSAGTSDSSTWANIPVATWDTSTAVNVALSGGNLTATTTGTSAGQGVRTADVFGRDNGKLYYEITNSTLIGGSAPNGAGVGTTTSTYAAMISTATTGAMVYFFSGNIWAGGLNTGISLGARANGDVIGVAVDLDNRKIWFKKVNGTPGNWNNSGSADPATNAGGVTVPAGLMVPFNTHGAVAGNITVTNFGASGFTGTVPSGFVSGWLFTSASFKLVATLTPNMAGYLIPQVKVAKVSTTVYIDPLAVVT